MLPAPPRPSASRGSTPLPSAEDLAAFGRHEAVRSAAERRASAQSELERALGRAGIPARFAGRDFACYRAETRDQQRALAISQAYAERFAGVRARGACLVLVGGPGTGKTHPALWSKRTLIFFSGLCAALRFAPARADRFPPENCQIPVARRLGAQRAAT